jgi:hypothetical protein
MLKSPKSAKKVDRGDGFEIKTAIFVNPPLLNTVGGNHRKSR